MAEKNQSSSYDSQTEKVTNRARITAILKSILQTRTLLRVTLPGSPTEYNSALLKINSEKNYILLDELVPKEGHEKLVKAKKLAVFTLLKGVDVSFASHLQQVIVKDDIAAYKVQLPKLLHYRQLRAHFRVAVGITEIPVNLTVDDELTLDGELHDISSGGLCIRFTGEIPASLKRGILVNSCMVDLPDGNTLDSRFEVRFRSNQDEKGRTLVGGKFVKLDRNQQRIVERYVATLDREIRRKT